MSQRLRQRLVRYFSHAGLNKGERATSARETSNSTLLQSLNKALLAKLTMSAKPQTRERNLLTGMTAIERLEGRIVLATTTFPETVSATPGVGAPQHDLTFHSVSGDGNNDGVITNGDRTPDWVVTLEVGGSFAPTHAYRLDLFDGATRIATSGNRAAGASTQNLTLSATGSNLGFGERQITARLFNDPDTMVESSFDFANAVTVRVNRSPLASSGTFDTDEDTSRTLSLADLSVSDPDGDGVTLQFVGGSNGSGTFSLQGGNTQIRYTPAMDANGNGIASVNYRAVDSFGAVSPTRTITFDVNAQPDAPRVSNPLQNAAGLSVDEDAPDTVIDLNNHFIEVDGEALTFMVTNNTNGTLVTTNVNGSMLTLDFQPDQNGQADITVRATDPTNRNVEDTFQVTVNSVLDPPTITGFTDDVEEQTGDLGDGALTNDNRPVIFGQAEEDATITLRLNDENGAAIGPAQVVGASETFSIVTNVDLPDGTNTIVAVAEKDMMTEVSAAFTIEVDTALQVPTFTGIDQDTMGRSAADQITSDNTPTFEGTADGFDANTPVTVTITDTTAAIVAGPVDVTGMATYSAPLAGAGLADGTHTFTATARDDAGNFESVMFDVHIDTQAPALTPLTFTSAQLATPLTVPVTRDQTPTFDVTVTERRFASIDHQLTTVQLIERLRDGTEVLRDELTNVTIAQGAEGLVDTVVSLESDMVDAGDHTYFVRVVDAAGNTNDSADLRISVLVPQQVTLDAPGTPAFTEMFDLRNLTDVNGDPLFNVQGDGDNIQLWQMSFDKSTQTVWINLERGRGTLHFDPASGQVEYFDYATIFGINGDTDSGANVSEVVDAAISNPHGLFFDFNTHVNPRVWAVHRNADALNDQANGDPADDTLTRVGVGGHGDENGRLSYLDLVTGELVSYDFEQLLIDAGIDETDHHNILNDLHAVFVDTKGDVWIAASEANKILQINFDDESVSNSLDSRSAKVIVHRLPEDLDVDSAIESDADRHFHVHGLDVIVDDETGETYVWIVDVEGTGRVGLLRPANGPDGQDSWVTWDLPDGVLGNDGEVVDMENVRAAFVKVDDNESPGDPRDDRIVFMSPVQRDPRVSGNTAGLVHVFDPGINTADPTSFTQGQLRTYQLPAQPGAATNTGLAAVNQPFVDREGSIIWVDRLSGAGRLDLESLEQISDAQLDPLTGFASDIFMFDVAGPTETFVVAPQLAQVDEASMRIETVGRTADFSNARGVDQYFATSLVTQEGPSGSSGAGPFRGALNAANTFFGSNTRLDQVSLTVFAETPRRQMSVVRLTPDDQLPANVLAEDRMAFQTIRTTLDDGTQTGSVILTSRANGQLLDDQVNLTQRIIDETGMTAQEVGFLSDPTAVVANGQVHVVGTGQDGTTLNRYRFDIATQTWSFDSFGAPAAGVLAGEPIALVDGNGNLAVTVTNSMLVGDEIESHLLLSTFDNAGEFVATHDLTALSGGDPDHFVYGNAAHIVEGDTLFLYGADQAGGIVEYQTDMTNVAGTTASVIEVMNLHGHTDRELRVLQNVYAEDFNGARHLFGTDGTSRLVHYEITADATMMAPTQAQGENVTLLTKDAATGYFDSFQDNFEARIYPEIAVLIDPVDSTLLVYGTNGGELIEFEYNGTNWSAANLTNDTSRGQGDRLTANSVFGAPGAYLGEDGSRHILQTNVQGEVVEYIYDRSTGNSFNNMIFQPRFTTRNLNLANGNEVQDLRRLNDPTTTSSGFGLTIVEMSPGEMSRNPVAIAADATIGGNLMNFEDALLVLRVANIFDGDQLSILNQGAGPGQIGLAGRMITYEGTQIGELDRDVPTALDQYRITLNGNADGESVQALLRALSFSSTGVFGSRAVEFEFLKDDGSLGDRAVRNVWVVEPGVLADPIVPLQV